MRQAMGEANMTVIAIVIIGIIAVAGAFIIPKMFTKVDSKTCCEENNGVFLENKCYSSSSCDRDSVTGIISNCRSIIKPKC